MIALIDGFPLVWQQEAITDSDLSVRYWLSNKQNHKIYGENDCIFHDDVLSLSGTRPSAEVSYREKYLSDKFYCDNKNLIDIVEKILRLRVYNYSKINSYIFSNSHNLSFIHKGCLDVNLSKLRLPICSQIFVSETFGNLVITIHTRNHK